MIRIRRKTKHLIYASLISAGVMSVIFTSCTIRYKSDVKVSKLALQQHYEQKIIEIKRNLKDDMINVWSLAREISAGHMITLNDLKQVELPKGRIPVDYVQSQSEIVGRISKLALQKQTLITKELIFENEKTTDDLRWREMSFVQLPAALKPFDVVDIRIQFPTGQDYILLGKKKIERYESETITIALNETEIHYLSSSIVDAYLHHASIYALTYVEPQLQHKAIPTYPVNDAVLTLINKDPNITLRAEQVLNKNARQALEKNLSKQTALQGVQISGLETK